MKWLYYSSLLFLLTACDPAALQAIVDDHREYQEQNIAQKSKEKKRLLKSGWRKYRHGNYKKSLKKSKRAAEIKTSTSRHAEPTDVAFSSPLLLSSSYFKLGEYDKALWAIKTYDNGYFTDAQHHTLDSLQMKVFAKKLGCDSFRVDLLASIDSLRRCRGVCSAYSLEVPLQSSKQTVVFHFDFYEWHFVTGRSFTYGAPITDEIRKNFRIHLMKSNIYTGMCDE